MGRARKNQQTERQAIVAAVRAKHQRQERKRAFRIYGTAAVFILALATTITSVIVVDQQNKAQTKAAASKPIDGVQSFDGLSRTTPPPRSPTRRHPPSGETMHPS